MVILCSYPRAEAKIPPSLYQISQTYVASYPWRCRPVYVGRLGECTRHLLATQLLGQLLGHLVSLKSPEKRNLIQMSLNLKYINMESYYAILNSDTVLKFTLTFYSPVDEVHGHRELVLVEHPVAVDVGQVPDLAQHRHRQLRAHHDLPHL